MKHLSAINKYFYKYRVRLSVGIFFIGLSNYFSVLSPQLTGFIIDFVQRNLPGYTPRPQHRSYATVVQWFISWVEGYTAAPAIKIVVISCLLILVLALLRGLFVFLMRQTIIVMSRHIEYDQKKEVYDHYQKLDATFYKTHTTGDLMSRMAEDVSRVRMFTGPAVMYFINLVTLIGMSVYFMLRRSQELTLYVLAPLPILAITIYLVNTIIHKKSEDLQASLAQVTTTAQQAYSGIRVIKSFVQERAMLDGFENASETYRQQASSLAKVEALYFPSMNLLIGLSTLLTIFIGGMYYINGHADIGIETIVEFVIYINMLTFPVSAIGWTASMIQRASASQKRLNEFLQIQPFIQPDAEGKKAVLTGAISMKNVWFTYSHTGIKAIKDVNLTIGAGQRIAIVGRTGSGKTTLAQLIMRLYDVDEGAIQFDGNDISKMDVASLRSQVSYVPQDGFLFSDTVASNIAFGTDAKVEADVFKAATMAAVAGDISGFAKGFETEIGERGVTLSGGQKQRISIARALLKQAPIVIFDDCLSAVDAKTEAQILSNLEEFMQGKTSIFITHRVFNLGSFEQVIVMDDGRVAEQGTHAQLLRQRGLYTAMYHRQMQEEQQAQ